MVVLVVSDTSDGTHLGQEPSLARGFVGVEVVRQTGDGSVPVFAAEAALLFAQVAFGTAVFVDGAGGAFN